MVWSSNNNSGGAAAAGRRRRPIVVAVSVQGKAGKTGPDQTKPRQGTTSKPAKPRPEFRKLPNFDVFLFVTSTPRGQVEDGGLSFGNFYITRSWEED